MSPIRNKLVNVIDNLPEAEQQLLFEIATRFLPDDIAVGDDLKAVETAREEFANGETASHEQINWD